MVSLKELYRNTTQETPFETIFKNIEMPDFENYETNSDEEEDEVFEQIKTPGLEKMYKEWKIKRLKKITNNIPERIQKMENSESYEETNVNPRTELLKRVST